MAGFLRSRLRCFYCGRVSSQKKTSGLECFRCESCEAENYLDENGEITDPPVHASSSARYASSLERPAAPLFDTAPNDIFCNVCIQNQRFYAHSLAEYYPTPNLATFEQYEKAEADYRAGLEQRYPLICSDCEPRARKRLKETSYAAKADNMRQIMERTRPELMHLKIPAPWKLWVLYLGGWAWTLSWAGQIVWDLISVYKIDPAMFHQLDNFYYQDVIFNFIDRLGIDEMIITSNLEINLILLAKYAIILGVLSVWWNPCLREKLWKKNSRILGKSDYYLQQFIFLCVRGSILYGVPILDVAASQQQAAHLFMIIFSLTAITRSLHTLKLDLTPKANWRESPKSLLAQPPLPAEQDTPTARRRRRRPSRETSLFPLESLAAKPLEPLSHHPASPSPPDYSGPSFQTDIRHHPNDMDWSPTLASPTRYQRPLPPPFKPNGTSSSGSIFSDLSPTKPTIPTQPPTATEDRLSRPSLNAMMADPTFFPPSVDKETGLESLFNTTFSISQPPSEVRHKASSSPHSTQNDTRSTLRHTLAFRLFSLTLLGSAYALLLYGDKPQNLPFVTDKWNFGIPSLSLHHRVLLILAACATASLNSLITTTLLSCGIMGRGVPALIAGIETVATAVFAGVVLNRVEIPGVYFARDKELGVVGVGQLAVWVVGVAEGFLVGEGVVSVAWTG